MNTMMMVMQLKTHLYEFIMNKKEELLKLDAQYHYKCYKC